MLEGGVSNIVLSDGNERNATFLYARNTKDGYTLITVRTQKENFQFLLLPFISKPQRICQ